MYVSGVMVKDYMVQQSTKTLKEIFDLVKWVMGCIKDCINVSKIFGCMIGVSSNTKM